MIISMNEFSDIFEELEGGDPSRADLLLPLVYDELRKLAAHRLAQEPSGQTLQPTALVHEAYLRIANISNNESWESKGHFFGAAAEAMRRILIDNARKKRSVKRGGGHKKLDLYNNEPTIISDSGIDLLALDAALDKLHSIDSRKASLVKLRYFAGLTLAEAANALDISSSTADTDWAYAKAWLKVELAEDEIDFN